MKLARQTPAPAPAEWLRRHAAGLGCCALGIAALAAGCWMQFGGERALTDTPDVRITVPLLVVTLAAGVASLARREGALVLPVIGVALAAAALVLGYVVLVVAVALGAALLLVLVHQMT